MPPESRIRPAIPACEFEAHRRGTYYWGSRRRSRRDRGNWGAVASWIVGRVLALGLDAADSKLLDQLMLARRMPNLARLRDAGTWAPLTSHDEYRAEHPWSTFVTGRNPANSGRWSTVRFDPATYEYETQGAFLHEPFYAVGDAATVAALDVPQSIFSRELQGSQVLGWGTHDPEFPRCSSPPGLLGDLEESVAWDRSIPLEYLGGWNQPRWIGAFGPALAASCRDRAHVIREVLDRTPDWSLGIAVFSAPHTLAHHTWHGVAPDSPLANAPTAAMAREHLLSTHTALDNAVAELHATLGPDDTLVVFSPKGMESARGEIMSMALLPELLHRRTFGTPLFAERSLRAWKRAGCPPVVPHFTTHHSSYMRRRFGVSAEDHRRIERHDRWLRLRRAVAQAVVPGDGERVTRPLPEPVKPRRLVEPAHETLRPEPGTLQDWHVATWYQPWWSQMPAFVLPSFADAHFRINIVGRERDGIVDRGDYRQACDEIEAWVRSCRSARTGQSVVADVWRPRADDPFEPMSPDADLVVSFSEDTDALEHPDLGSAGPFPAARTGTHSANGFALFVGADIRAGEQLETRELVDLPATILALAGVTPRHPLDGTPMSPVLSHSARR